MSFMKNPIYLIAEIGINHNGNLNDAETLIRGAAEAKANAIKFQYRNLERSYLEKNHMEIGDEILKSEITNTYISPKEILSLTKLGKKLGLDVGISFFCAEDMGDFKSQIEAFDFFKLPSVELLNFNLIEKFSETGKDIYISTGCSSEKDLRGG